MIAVISYVSKDFKILDTMPESFASLMLAYTYGENVLVGSKFFEQELDSKPLLTSKTFVLSRHKTFSNTTAIKKPEDFKDGIVLGGRSTIASMLPYTDSVLLGFSNNVGMGTSFPSLKGFELSDVIDTNIKLYLR